MADCLFCNIVAGKIPSKKVYEDDKVFAFHDVSPQAPTHILIVPKVHKASLNDIDASDETLMGHIAFTAKELALSAGHKDWRLVANCGAEAGQSVFHIHFHLLAGRPLAWPPG